LIRLLRQGLASQQVCTRPIRPAINGFGQEVLRLDGPQLPLLHDSAHNWRSSSWAEAPFCQDKKVDELHFEIATLTFSEGVFMLLTALSTGPTFKRTSHLRYLYQGGSEWLPIFICAWLTLR
jgi:hypothetical protein